MDYKALMEAQIKIMEDLFSGANAENREMTSEETSRYEAAETEFKRLRDAKAKADKIAAMRSAVPEEPAHEPASAASAASAVSAGANLAAQKPFESFGHLLQDVAGMRSSAESLERIRNANLNTETGQDGGVLVPTEFISGLMDLAKNESQLYSRCRHIQAKGNTVSIPGIDETSRADGSRYGGIQFSWVREGGQGSYTQPKYRPIDIKLGKLLGLTAITEELLQDAQALESWVKMAFPSEMAFALDQAIFDGDGNGKPLGLMNSPALVTVAKEGSQTADTVNFQNVVKMYARMPFSSQQNAVWLITPQVQEQLPVMNLSVGTGGSAVYLPAGGASEAPFQRLFGRPVIPIEQATTLGDLGDIVFADLSDYIIYEKGGLRTESSIHVYFDTDVRAYRFVKRINGAPYTRSALASRALSTYTTSPYVTLAARA